MSRTTRVEFLTEGQAILHGSLCLSKPEATEFITRFPFCDFNEFYQGFCFPQEHTDEVKEWLDGKKVRCLVPWASLRCVLAEPNLIEMSSPITGVPEKLMQTLYPFQKQGVSSLLCERRVLLADEMGTGKTISAMALASATPGHTLVICPSAVARNWLEKAQEYCSEAYTSIGALKNIRPSTRMFCVATYSELVAQSKDGERKGYTRMQSLGRWAIVVCDEAHAFCGSTTIRTKLLALNAESPVQKAERVVLISGTPLLARHEQLYAQCRILFPHIFASYEDFILRYCDAKKQSFPGRPEFWDARGASCVFELQALLSKRMVRRTKAEIQLQLPPKTIVTQDLTLVSGTPEAEVYANIDTQLQKLRDQRDEAERKGRLADMGAILRQLEILTTKARVATAQWKAADPSFLSHVVGLVRGHAPGQRSVVFAHHSVLRDALARAFEDAGMACIQISGEHTADQKHKLVQRLLDPTNDLRVGILSTRALGVGVTLVPLVTLMIKADRDWTPGVEDQADDRIHRIGCTHPVTVVMLKALHSFDERLWRLLEKKSLGNRAAMGDDLAVLGILGIRRFAEYAPRPLSIRETLDQYLLRVGETIQVDDLKWALPDGEEWYETNELNQSSGSAWLNVSEWSPTKPFPLPVTEAVCVGGQIYFARRKPKHVRHKENGEAEESQPRRAKGSVGF